MVIKKPYAFLIKHFRLVHGLLFVLLVYLIGKSFNIYGFFNSYAINHTYVNQGNLASTYISIPMYIAAIISALVMLVIYFLLSVKRKNNLVYLLGVIYFVILIIFFFHVSTVFDSLQSKALSVETVRIYRDVSLIVLMPQIVFLFIIVARMLGFNLKQFDFKKDIEELDIDVTDDEEVELTFGNDSYKISRFIRKFIRLSKYFFVENKLFVIAASSLIVFGISFFIYTRFERIQRSYEESQDLNISSLSFSVKNSYITNVDSKNNVISSGKYYLLVDVFVKNRYNIDYALTRETFRLEVGDELLIPTFRLNKEFYDIGSVYNPIDLKPGEEKDYLIVFEINDEDVKKDYLFKVKNYNGFNDIKYDFYKEVVIKPENLNVNEDLGHFTAGDTIDLKDSLLKNSTVTINKIEIASKFREEYTYKVGNETKKGVYSIIPSSTNKASLSVLKIDSKVNIDKDVVMSKYLKIPADLYDQYGIIRYNFQGTYKTSKLTKIKVNYNNDTLSYLEIPKEVEVSTDVDLILLIRGRKYTISLK